MAVDRFVQSIIEQESGRNYGAVNKRTGALGGYQVMPQNLDGSWGGRKPRANFGWDYEALGRDVTPQEFLSNPAIQDQIAQYQLKRAYAKHGAEGAARWWYSNSPNPSNNRPTPNEPSPNEYAQKFASRLGANPVPAQPAKNDPAMALLQRRNPREYEQIMRQRGKPPANRGGLAAHAEQLPAPNRGGGGGGQPAQPSPLQGRILAARENGYSDQDIFGHLQQTNGAVSQRIKQARDSGYSDNEIAGFLGLKIGDQPKPEAPPMWQSALLGVSDALGATLVQGAAKAGDVLNREVINPLFGTNLEEDAYGKYTRRYNLARQEFEQQREDAGAGFDGARLVGNLAGSAPLMMMGGSLPQGAKLLSQAGAKFIASNAAAGGAAGAAMFAKNADDRISNTVNGAAIGAVAAPVVRAAGQALQPVVRRVANARQAVGGGTQARAEATATIEAAFTQNGIDLNAISTTVRNDLIKEVEAAIKSGKAVSPEAIVRKATLGNVGLTGTRAQVTGRAQDWQKERELAKLQDVGDPLRDKFVADHDALKTLMDDAATATGGRAFDRNDAMQATFEALRKNDELRNAEIRTLYDAARNATGNELQLNAPRFVNDVSNELERNGLGTFLKSDVRGILGGLFDGKAPLTIAKKEELVKVLNAGLANTTDGSRRQALQIVRDKLENEVTQTLDEFDQAVLGQGGDAVQAWQAARNAARERFGLIDRTPAIKAALDDVAPDRAFEKLVLNANERDLLALAKELENQPEALNGVRQQTVQWIAEQATRANNGAFSPAAMNNALRKLGDRRLNALFSPEEVAKIKNINEAARYLMTQPPESAVNNSNTGAALANHLMASVGSLVQATPFVGNLMRGSAQMAIKVAQNAKATAQTGAAMRGGVTTGERALSGAERELIQKYGFIMDASGRLVRAGAVQGGVNE